MTVFGRSPLRLPRSLRGRAPGRAPRLTCGRALPGSRWEAPPRSLWRSALPGTARPTSPSALSPPCSKLTDRWANAASHSLVHLVYSLSTAFALFGGFFNSLNFACSSLLSWMGRNDACLLEQWTSVPSLTSPIAFHSFMSCFDSLGDTRGWITVLRFAYVPIKSSIAVNPDSLVLRLRKLEFFCSLRNLQQARRA